MSRRHKADGTLQKALARPSGVRLTDPRVERLTARFLEIVETTNHFLVDQSVLAGRVLEEGRQLLSRASFSTWHVQDLGISEGTVRNYLNTAELERHSRAQLEKWKFLGPAKIYRLARMTAERRREVLKLPGLDEMSYQEFVVLTHDDVQPTVEVTPNMLGHGLFEKAKGLQRKLDAIVLPAIKDPALRKKVKEQLLEVASSARALAKEL